MIRVVVSGGFGRMGSKVVQAVMKAEDMEIVGILEQKKEKLKDIKVYKDVDDAIELCDVVVEFSTPEATMSHLGAVSRNHKAMVIGTTGFSEAQITEIENASDEVPILLSPNMSWGANVTVKTAKFLNSMLNGYDVEVIEFHHRFKKDAPSGTAKLLVDSVKRDDTEITYGRSGYSLRKRGEIGVHSLRGGDVVGEHKVIWAGVGERIELLHIVWDRNAFAYGTLKAIRFITTKNSGLYSLEDIFEEGEE